MNGATFLISAILIYTIAYRFYGRYLRRLFCVESNRPTPAQIHQDGMDYVPAKAPVLFGHHFASIAGAGPIVGPVLGVCFGWIPVALWVIFGCVFIGAAHDFAALFVSIRHDGRSIGHIIEQHISYPGRQLFLLFCFAALVLVVAIFALLVAKTFVASPAVATASILFIILAVIFGKLVYQGRLSLLKASVIFVPLLFVCIYIGIRFPLDLMAMFNLTAAATQNVWLIFLFIYIFVASIVPVWLLLQPRDYLNSYLLYTMIALGIISIFVVAPTFQMPAFAGLVVQEPTKGVVRWSLFPILYVTVACGACSGFHALVASGTTAKQLASEKHILPIGYGAMLLEGIVAVMALVSVAILSKTDFINVISQKGAVNTFASGLAGLATKIGLPQKTGETFLALTISAFMLTTLDTAARLTRFTVQELFLPRKEEGGKRTSKVAQLFTNRYVATLVVVLLAGYLAISGDAGKIWPVFGASNQLLAALTLLLVVVVLIKKKRNFWSMFLPFLFMISMSSWALGELLRLNWATGNWGLVVASGFLLILAGLLVVQTFFKIRRA